MKDEKGKSVLVLQSDKKGHITVSKLTSDGQSLAGDG